MINGHQQSKWLLFKTNPASPNFDAPLKRTYLIVHFFLAQKDVYSGYLFAQKSVLFHLVLASSGDPQKRLDIRLMIGSYLETMMRSDFATKSN